jgi:hypothetical protein
VPDSNIFPINLVVSIGGEVSACPARSAGNSGPATNSPKDTLE